MNPITGLFAQTFQCLLISCQIKATHYDRSCLPGKLSVSSSHCSRYSSSTHHELPAEGLGTCSSLCLAGTPRRVAPCLTLGLYSNTTFPARTPLATLSQILLSQPLVVPFPFHWCFLAVITFFCIIYVTNFSCLISRMASILSLLLIAMSQC